MDERSERLKSVVNCFFIVKPDRFLKSVRFVVAHLGRCPHRTMRAKVISGSDFSGKSGLLTIAVRLRVKSLIFGYGKINNGN